MRVAIYTRLSPNPNKKDTENQERELREFCARTGWDIVAVYTDIHVSGAIKGKDKPQFALMMMDASKKKFDIVLFWALDRLSREGTYETLTYLRQLDSYGVGYRSYTEPYFDSCGVFKDAIIGIMATLAKQERLRLIDRTKAGLATALLNGKKLGRAYATTKTRTRPNPVNADEVIRLRSEGNTIRQIAGYLNQPIATVFRILRRNNVR